MEFKNKSEDLLHWVSLSKIMDVLIEEYWFEELSELVRINCFKNNPSKESSLKFLRKTEWARKHIEWLYVRTMKEKNK